MATKAPGETGLRAKLAAFTTPPFAMLGVAAAARVEPLKSLVLLSLRSAVEALIVSFTDLVYEYREDVTVAGLGPFRFRLAGIKESTKFCRRVLQILEIRDVLPIKDSVGLAPAEFAGDLPGHACPSQIAGALRLKSWNSSPEG